MKQSREKALLEIYDQIPRIRCRRRCFAACSTIPLTTIELQVLESKVGRSLPRSTRTAGPAQVVIGDDVFRCPVLSGRLCSGYEARPLICRIWGVAEGLECKFGCEPERVLSRAEVQALFESVQAI